MTRVLLRDGTIHMECWPWTRHAWLGVDKDNWFLPTRLLVHGSAMMKRVSEAQRQNPRCSDYVKQSNIWYATDAQATV